MKYIIMMATMLLIEWVVVLTVQENVEELRLALTGLVPMVLEYLKNYMLGHPWPKKTAANMMYPLIVEMVRFLLIVIALFMVTSVLEKEKSLYALLFCGNFFGAIAVNIVANWDKINK